MKKVDAFRKWSNSSVRKMCVEHELYTNGCNEDYDHMLSWVDRLYPNYENMLFIAEDIVKHSEEADLANIMFLLEREAVTTFFEIKD